MDATTGKDIFTTGNDCILFSVSKYAFILLSVGLFRAAACARCLSAATLARVRSGCGGSGYEFGDDVLKFPSASRGNPAAAGFAEALSSSAFAFSFACSIVMQVSDVVALHSKSDSVPAHPVKSKALPRGINSINSFIYSPLYS